MGFSMLGGIVQSILSGITGVIMAIVEPILKIVLNFVNRFIIAPLISAVISIIRYMISLFFYNIACFILALIDYVEMLFRLLAGLDVDGVSLNLSNSPDKGADLVVQLIRTPEIRDMFLSMVVVGMFLLIITTIFQMIKVEYTTEGAKNAKGPILSKAFKGLCNMILIPALCIFGVILGNQILDLLDKATKPDSTTGVYGNTASATISGTLFVAAAGEAHYQKGDMRVVLISPDAALATSELVLNIVPIIFNSIADAWGEAFNADDTKEYLLSDAQRKEAESLVASGTLSYWNIAAISQIYDYSKINYLLLIFGGCIVIKTLYYTCFGMIVRLYQCGMLFIISPAVIGMTPINEGGLGKWRSEFIGQAISAYGVILALNIFFVLVRVLLSIDFSFEGVSGYFFGAGMMEGLLKAIIVMGGTLSIEKFSKEIGGYFGAKDALSQGKEMEKAIGDQAKKAVSTAVSVAMMATGVGGGAMAAVKGLGGAMKAGKAAAQVAGKKGGALKGAMNYIGDGIADKGTSAMQYVADSVGADVDIKGSWLKGRAARAEKMGDKGLNDAIALVESGTGKEEAAVTAAKGKVATEQQFLKQLKDNQRAGGLGVTDADIAEQEAKVRRAQREQKKAESNLSFKQNAIASAESNIDILAEHAASRSFDEKAQQQRAVQHQSERILRRETGRQAAKSFFEEKTIFGQAFAGVKKQVGGYEDAAAKEGGKEVTAALEHLRKVKSDSKEDAANIRNKDAITRKNEAQAREIKTMAVEEVKIANAHLELQAKDMLDQLNQMASRYNSMSNDDPAKGALATQMENYKNAMIKELGIDFNDVAQHGDTRSNNISFTITDNGEKKIKMDTGKIESLIASIMKNGGMDDKDAIKQAVLEAMKSKDGEAMSPSEARKYEQIFEKVIAKYNNK